MKTKIHFMTSEELHALSHGEVLLPDLYNFRETPPLPVPTGLMCQTIFGPVKDYCCACGAIDGKVNEGATCHICGVDIVSSSVRSTRMGHISLAFPCIHPLAVKWISIALGISITELQSIVNGTSSVFFEAGGGQLVVEGVVGHLQVELGCPTTLVEGTSFAISLLIDSLDFDATLENVSGVRKFILKRLKEGQQYIVKDILVTPADYRPLIQLEDTQVTSAINQLYEDVIRKSLRIGRMIKYNPPSLILVVEMIQLQYAVDRLFIEGLTKKGVEYKSLLVGISKKSGLFRKHLFGKRVDFSGRSVISSGPELDLDEVGLPIKMVLELTKPFLINYFRKKGFKYKTIHKMLKNYTKYEEVRVALDHVCADQRIILNRQPTLHKLGIRAFKIKIHDGKTILLPALVCGGYNADFDGDSCFSTINLTFSLNNNKKYNITCHIADLETMEV